MANKSPAFQFYPKDFLTDQDVRLMRNRERGAYIVLLCHCWLEGSIPADMDNLATLAGEDVRDMEIIWPKIAGKFKKKGGKLVNRRLEKERKKQRKFSREMKAAAIKRWQKGEHKKAEKEQLPSVPTHSQGNAGDASGRHMRRQSFAVSSLLSPDDSKSSGPVSSVKTLIDHFHQTLQLKCGDTAKANYAQLGRILKVRLATIPEAELRSLIERWFSSTDPFIVSNWNNVGLFDQKLHLLKSGPIKSLREVSSETHSASRGTGGVEAVAGKYEEVYE